jgi:hypothetical protein
MGQDDDPVRCPKSREDISEHEACKKTVGLGRKRTKIVDFHYLGMPPGADSKEARVRQEDHVLTKVPQPARVNPEPVHAHIQLGIGKA